MKRHPTYGKKIFENHLSNKDFVSRIYKEPLQLNNRKINNPIKNWAKDLNRHLKDKENRQKGKKHMKRCSTSWVMREIQVKTTTIYYFISTRIAIIKKMDNNKHWWGCREIATLSAGRNVNWCNHFGKPFNSSSKI